MLTEKNIFVPIWGFKIEVCIFDNIAEAKSKYPEYIDEGMTAVTLEWKNQARCKVIIPSDNYSDVVHELEHVKNIIWKNKDYTPQKDNDEPDAYLMGWMFRQVESLIKRHLASQC